MRLVERGRDPLRDAGGAAALPGPDAHGDAAEGNRAGTPVRATDTHGVPAFRLGVLWECCLCVKYRYGYLF